MHDFITFSHILPSPPCNVVQFQIFSCFRLIKLRGHGSKACMSNHVQGFSPGLVHLGSVSLHFWVSTKYFKKACWVWKFVMYVRPGSIFVFWGGFVYLSPPSLHFPSHHEAYILYLFYSFKKTIEG